MKKSTTAAVAAASATAPMTADALTNPNGCSTSGSGHRKSLPHLSLSPHQTYVIKVDSSVESRVPPNSVHLPPVPSTFLMPIYGGSDDDDDENNNNNDDLNYGSLPYSSSSLKKRRDSILEVILNKQTMISKKISRCSDSFTSISCIPKDTVDGGDAASASIFTSNNDSSNQPSSPIIILPERPTTPLKRKEPNRLRGTDSLRIFIYAILVPLSAILVSLIITAFIVRIDSGAKTLSVAQFDFADHFSLNTDISNPYGIFALGEAKKPIEPIETIEVPNESKVSNESKDKNGKNNSKNSKDPKNNTLSPAEIAEIAQSWIGVPFRYSPSSTDWKRIPYGYNDVNFNFDLRKRENIAVEAIAERFISKYPDMQNDNTYTDYRVFPGFDRNDLETRKLRQNEYQHFKQYQQYLYWIRNRNLPNLTAPPPPPPFAICK